MIESELLIDVNPEDPYQILDKLNRLSVIISNSAKTVSDSKYLVRKAEIEKLRELQKKDELVKMPPSTLSKILAAHVSEEQHLYDRSDRFNSALVHSIDSYRSSLSFLKTEKTIGQRS